MSKSEARPDFSQGNTFGVHGDRIDIGLSTLDEFAVRLGQVGEVPLKLIDSEELSTQLPPPIEKVIFEARIPRTGDTMPTLSASVDLSIDTIRDFRSEKENMSWSTPYLSLVISYLSTSGFTVDFVPHDLNTVHVRLDKNYAASIKIVGDLQSCVVELSLETIDDLENAIGEMSEVPPDEPSQAVIVAQYFATALGATIDAALETFDVPNTGRHLLELTHPTNTRAQAKLAKKAAALAALEQPSFPEAERIRQVRGLARLPGLFAAKRRLQEIAEDFGDPVAAKMYEINPTHFLLYGPPGTGKSTIVEALAEEIDAEYVSIPTSSIHGENVGSSAKNLQAVFDAAFEKNTPQVLFFDEFETLGRTRNGTTNHLEARKLLQQLILKTSKEHPEIIIAAAMNADRDDIEPALIRPGRFETIQVSLPTAEERLDILTSMISSSLARLDILDIELTTLDSSTGIAEETFILYDESINCLELARKMEDYSIADIMEALKLARRTAYQRYKATNTLDAVSHQDIIASIDMLRLR